METQKIQATITLALTPEQLLMLLNAQPPAPQPTPAPMPQTAAPAPAPQQTPVPQNLGQMFPATAAPTPNTQPVQQNPMPQTQPAPIAQPMPTQTAPQTYSVQELGLAARPLMETGRQQELIALLTEFGAASVAAIPEDRRADFAARLRALGGQI